MNVLDLLEKQRQERKDKPCNCHAYKFPHRRYGGSCEDDGSWMELTDKLRLKAWDRKTGDSYE